MLICRHFYVIQLISSFGINHTAGRNLTELLLNDYDILQILAQEQYLEATPDIERITSIFTFCFYFKSWKL